MSKIHPKTDNPILPKKCGICGEIYDASTGGPMILKCGECFNKPAPPPSYIEKNGLLVPNPALAEME